MVSINNSKTTVWQLGFKRGALMPYTRLSNLTN